MNTLRDLAALPCYDLQGIGSEAAILDFQRYGCLQVSDFLPPGIARKLQTDFLAQSDQLVKTGGFAKVGHRRLMIPVPVSGQFAAQNVHSPEPLVKLFSSLLGDDYIINCFTCVVSQPGAKAQHMHTDFPGLFDSAMDRFAPSYAINLFIPLVELNAQTGTTEMWPGSHRKPLDNTQEITGVRPDVTLGSAVLMDYRVQHRGLANKSSALRPVLTLAFSRSWFVDTRNFETVPPIALENADYDKMDPASQKRFARGRLSL